MCLTGAAAEVRRGGAKEHEHSLANADQCVGLDVRLSVLVVGCPDAGWWRFRRTALGVQCPLFREDLCWRTRPGHRPRSQERASRDLSLRPTRYECDRAALRRLAIGVSYVAR
jgi:hypothetical protein